MFFHPAIALGLLAHPGQSPKAVAHHPEPGVRIWVSDTLFQVGAGARVYVQLREPGYLVVLHVDAMGRIRLLYPATPDDQPPLPAGAPFEVTGADSAATFRVETRGRGTLLAARSPHPFQFGPVRHGHRWDYDQSLLLQPTAGNPFAALLDIADRVADAQPYDYDVTAYGTPGTLAQRSGADSVCYSCLTARHARSTSGVAGGYGTGAVAIDHSYAAANNSSVVDCSGANLVNSYCGVQDNGITNVYTTNSVTESNVVEYPVYVPFFVQFRSVRPTPPTPPPPPAITLPKPLRRVSTRVVPPPPRPRPHIVVVQPTAPSHPQRTSDQPDAMAEAPISPPAAPMVRPIAARPSGFVMARAGRMQGGSMEGTTTFPMPTTVAPAAATTIATPGFVAPRSFVPSRALLRSINAARH